MLNIRAAVTSFSLPLVAVSPALAADTSKVYNSGLLVLLFVGFCAFLIVVQVLPAILSVMGLTKNAAKSVVETKAHTVPVKKR